MFKHIMEEEGARTPGHESKELSSLVRWSGHLGAMWVHMLLTTGFNDTRTFPFTELIEHAGIDEQEKRKSDVSEDEITAFGTQKLLQLEQYKRDLERIETHTLVDEGKITKEEFLSMHSFFQPPLSGTGDFVPTTSQNHTAQHALLPQTRPNPQRSAPTEPSSSFPPSPARRFTNMNIKSRTLFL